MYLASRFSSNRTGIRSDTPLSDAQIMQVAPSIFAEDKHESRSGRYTYIPTIDVLRRLRSEGFMPFYACQTRCRDVSKTDYTKHMLRLRHASQITAGEANEIILLNSHDGSSSYQMLSGVFRFACANGLVSGTVENDVRVPHKGKILDNVIEGAFRVLDDFELIEEQKGGMKSLALNAAEQQAFAESALALKWNGTTAVAPITGNQLLTPRRWEDRSPDLWTTFNRVQENLLRGGVAGRTARGRNMQTREVTGIDSNVGLNRALWVLAEKMRALKAA